jgi:hypothetical protein
VLEGVRRAMLRLGDLANTKLLTDSSNWSSQVVMLCALWPCVTEGQTASIFITKGGKQEMPRDNTSDWVE